MTDMMKVLLITGINGDCTCPRSSRGSTQASKRLSEINMVRRAAGSFVFALGPTMEIAAGFLTNTTSYVNPSAGAVQSLRARR